VIVGPTGVGKTETACAVARSLGGQIVSADSRQIYRGMNVGTAKPSEEELSSVPHHMIDVADPTEEFDAARYAEMARECVRKIQRAGMLPILVGGTGLYVKAALEGLTPAPARDEALRRRLRQEERSSPGTLYARLRRVDPVRAAEVSPGDLTRIVRALEVYELSGSPMSSLRERSRPDPVPHVCFGLVRPRRRLYERIDARVLKMVECGLFEEVEGLLRRGVPEDAPGLRSIGYREIVACLRGEFDRETAVALVQRNSRRYAKRQMTWFRRMSVRRWISVRDAEEAAAAIVAEWRACG